MRIFIPLIVCFALFGCKGSKKSNNNEQQQRLAYYNSLGLAQLDSGNYVAAAISFKDALSVGVMDTVQKVKLLRNIAVAYFEIGQKDTSRYYSLLASEAAPKFSSFYYINKADVFLLDSIIDSAIVYLTKGMELGGESMEVCNALGMIYLGYYGAEYRDLEKALYYNEQAFNINPGRMTENLLALSYLANDSLRLAEQHYSGLSSRYSQVVEYKVHLCIIKNKLNKMNEYDSLLQYLTGINPAYKQAVEDILSR